MKRRAQSADIMMKIAFAIFVFAVLIFVFKKYADKADTFNTCESGTGQCKASCIPGVERQTGAFCKTTAQVCCVTGLSGAGGGGTTPGGGGGGSGTESTLQALSIPTIKFWYNTEKSPSRVPVIGGMEKDIVLVADITVPYYDPALVQSSKTLSVEDKKICTQTDAQTAGKQIYDQKGVCDKSKWVINITLETISTKRVIEYKYDLVGPTTEIINSYRIGPDGKTPISGPKYLIGEAQPQDDSAIKGVAYMKNAREIITLHVDPSLAKDFSGQSVNLVITVHPAGNPTSPITAQYRVALASTLLARYEGLSQVWSQEKSINTYCDKDNVRCDMMAFSTQANVECPDTPGTNVKQSLTIIKKVYYITKSDGTKYSTVAYDTQTSCEGAINTLGGSIEQQLISAASVVNKVSGTGSDIFQNKDLANIINQQNGNLKCTDGSSVKTTSEDVTGPYLTDTFNSDPAIQKGTIRLAQAGMAGRYLCVYGHDNRTDKWFSAGKGQKIMVDRTAPQVNMTYYPWTGYRIVIDCMDGKSGDTTESGCKPSFEYAYISEPMKFLSALVSGPQTAAQWCPTSGYVTSSQQLINYNYVMNITTGANITGSQQTMNYNYDGIRVMCARWQDKAGNQGLSMVTVYNSYELLAKAIMMQQQQKAK